MENENTDLEHFNRRHNTGLKELVVNYIGQSASGRRRGDCGYGGAGFCS